jgi:ribosome maturation factor RimP
MTTADRLRELIEPIVADLGVELFDLEYGASKLTVTVDRPDGIDMEAVAAATRAISRMLDEADPVPGHYTLEVSSPGLERTLRTPAHFTWAIGQQVSVKTVPAYEGPRRVKGTILDTADDTVVLETTEGELELAYTDIDKARTVFEWGGQPKKSNTTKTTKTKRAKVS